MGDFSDSDELSSGLNEEVEDYSLDDNVWFMS